MMREAVDFHLVPQHQEAMHIRLINWGRAQRNTPGQACAPMFRQYRSSDQWEGTTSSPSVDKLDAEKINNAWKQLPTGNRAALAWQYVTPSSPSKACERIGCTMADLARFVVDGRQMLLNRNV
jgi:hypothetical protein